MSGSRGGRKKKAHAEDEHPDERWMASYMDMITVLMCMFIVLFAMSSVDQDKYIALRNSLATGFGQTDVGKVDSAKGTVVPPDEVSKTGDGYAIGDAKEKSASAASGQANTAVDLAQKELDDLTAIKQAITANLEGTGLKADVEFATDARGLTVRLVGSETFFGTNSADLSDTAVRVMDAIAPVLKTSEHDVSVEGHADQRNSTAPYATNWELSSARATQVLRDLVERGGMPEGHIQAVGFGSSRPLATGATDTDFASNRRVDIVVLSNQSDDVSALIPELEKKVEGAGGTTPATTTTDTSGAGTTGTTTTSTDKTSTDKTGTDRTSTDKKKKEATQSGGH
ncbi:OmpA/MotB family protein [Frigoribacterium sp. 2-23]|uniref:OmpA/MotB family protein n=1 Tax=Frigoribacterium sp. 2-23 TaxID=3415006 RepID=UPI003C6F7492